MPWDPGRRDPWPAPPTAAVRRRSKRAGWARPDGSTRFRPGSPGPNRGGPTPGGSGGRGLFFSRVGWVGTGDPVLGPSPADAQAFQGLADGFARQWPRRTGFAVDDLGDTVHG